MGATATHPSGVPWEPHAPAARAREDRVAELVHLALDQLAALAAAHVAVSRQEPGRSEHPSFDEETRAKLADRLSRFETRLGSFARAAGPVMQHVVKYDEARRIRQL